MRRAADPPLDRPIRFRNLTFRGSQGIHATVGVAFAESTFEMISGEALDLDAGSHKMADSVVLDSVGVGADVAAGASLIVARTTMTGLSNAGLIVDGSAYLENVVIAGGAGGIRLGQTGAVDVHYSTITDNAGIGIDNSHSGQVTVDRSIVYDNFGDDMLNVDCTGVSWSDTSFPNCSFVNDNISADPQLEFDYRLTSGSPCLDHGPHPQTYEGYPLTDLDGNARLLDYDGDGLAVNDVGAYEHHDSSLVPGEVANLRWDFDFRLLWDAEPSAQAYHVYRGDLDGLSYQSFGACRDDLDDDLTDLQLDDFEEPAIGSGSFYLITAEDQGGNEGTLGYAEGAERSNFDFCP